MKESRKSRGGCSGADALPGEQTWAARASVGFGIDPTLASPPAARNMRVHYSHGSVWIVLLVKLMFRASMLAPLSAATPVGCSPVVAQIRLSWT